jgi:hypothetical protein
VLERDGVYGMPMDDVLQFEGTYQIHAIGRYGDSCRGQRDTSWSIQVFPGIDPGKSGVDVKDDGPADGGGHKGSIVFTPRDRYGHPLGPGRGTLFDPGAAAGTNVTGPVTDNGDGSYTIPVSWDPAGAAPGLVVSQPDRPGVPIGPAFGGGAVAWWCRWPWLPWLLVALIVVLIVLLLLLLLLT